MIGCLACLGLLQAAGPVPVTLRRTGDRYTLLRGGVPYVVKGVGGTGRMALLRKLGGNSMRTWGADGLFPTLDEAQSFGLTVTIGIWLGHREHGFDYADKGKVAAQLEQARTFVEAYKNHPALLMWGLGNEMEREGNDTEALWKAVEDIAKMVKERDPNHPTMTVVQEVDQGKIERIKKFAPDVDILGVNAYGGAPSVATRLRQYGWTKPFIMTEFGPFGSWERPSTPWGAPIEQTSTEKAESYRNVFAKTIDPNPGWCLGSYAFLWGNKDEGTPTWYGMFLPSGERLGALDVLTAEWIGTPPATGAPKIESLSFEGTEKVVKPGAKLVASVKATGAVMVKWRLCVEGKPDTVDSWDGDSVQVVAPWAPGQYRLYVTVFDGKDRAATANVPFKVDR